MHHAASHGGNALLATNNVRHGARVYLNPKIVEDKKELI